MSNTTETSTILLACIGVDEPSARYRDLHVDDLHTVFSQFGEVCKVIIFSKRSQLKAFIEYMTAEQSAIARSFLHNCTLDNFGQTRIYFSAMQGLEFSNKYLEYKEYTAPRRDSLGSQLASTRLSPSETMALAENALMFEDPVPQIPQKPARQILGEKPLFSNTNQSVVPSAFKRYSDPLSRKPEAIVVPPKSPFMDKYQTQNRPPIVLQRANTQGARTLIPGGDSKPTPVASIQGSPMIKKAAGSPLLLKSPMMPVLFRGDSGAEDSVSLQTAQTQIVSNHAPSNVILISNLDECFFTVAELYAVFSCFGNIVKLLLMKNLKKAMVEYLSEEAAAAAFLAMNLRVFGNTKIKVNYSKYRKIDLKKNNKSENSQNFNEVMVVSPDMYRYKDAGAQEACGPSDTLLVVVEKRDGFRPIDLLMHMQTVSKVVGTRTLVGDKENEDDQVQKVLFRFKNEVEAIRVLSQVHGTKMGGVTLSGTFSQISI